MPQLPVSIRVEGHAIVSANGMIADAQGGMPPALRNDADWRLFQAALDDAVLVVVGRLGHERHANPGRERLVPTASVTGLQRDQRDPNAILWNPSALDIAGVLRELGIESGAVAVTGGRRVFDLFVPHYDVFALSEVTGFVLADGIPAFSTGHPALVLATAGLTPEASVTIDAAAGVTLTRWLRSRTDGTGQRPGD